MKIENVKCTSCGANIKINKDGDTVCPYCSAPFSVTEQDTKVIINNTTINNIPEPKPKKSRKGLVWSVFGVIIGLIFIVLAFSLTA